MKLPFDDEAARISRADAGSLVNPTEIHETVELDADGCAIGYIQRWDDSDEMWLYAGADTPRPLEPDRDEDDPIELGDTSPPADEDTEPIESAELPLRDGAFQWGPHDDSSSSVTDE